jgi:hypothetical protein
LQKVGKFLRTRERRRSGCEKVDFSESWIQFHFKLCFKFQLPENELKLF